MTARFNRRWALASRANLALALTLLTTGSALAAPGTPGQRRGGVPMLGDTPAAGQRLSSPRTGVSAAAADESARPTG